jgi:dihydroorotate dehydrogenase (NAD+) catalytic subunit
MEKLRNRLMKIPITEPINMSINFCGTHWANPVTTAAGTFHTESCSKYYDPRLLGAITTKGVSAVPWQGNKLPRIAETHAGMLNSVGLENPGAEAYIKGELATLKAMGVTVIANVAGHSLEEYEAAVRILAESDVDMLELNVSCPNVAEGGMAFGTDPKAVAEVTASTKKLTNKPIIVKLTPNVTDICEIAKSAESAGADALSLINTLVGMRLDLNTRKPILSRGTGGLSGPAIKPIAIAAVNRVSEAVKIPLIGMGGIMSGEDAYEFLIAGATAVAIGTAALTDPGAPARIVDELEICYHRYGKL